MANMSSRVYRQYDAEEAVELRADVAAETGAGTEWEMPIALNTLTKAGHAYWDNDEVPNGVISVAVNVTQIDLDTTGYTYTLHLQVDNAGSFAGTNPTTVASLPVYGLGFHEILINSKTIEKLCKDRETVPTQLRIGVTMVGSTSDINYRAWATHRGV